MEGKFKEYSATPNNPNWEKIIKREKEIALNCYRSGRLS